jgi:hypothetical protein
MASSATSSKATPTFIAAGGAVLVTAAGLVLLLHRRNNSVAEFYNRHRGMAGLLRYAWLGDHLPPEIRISMDELDDVEKRMHTSREELDNIETSIERARLESVDDGTTTATTTAARATPATDTSKDVDESITRRSFLFQQDPTLRTRIGMCSNTLDVLASTVDNVKSHSDTEVKKRKKASSDEIVRLMNELDRIVSTIR